MVGLAVAVAGVALVGSIVAWGVLTPRPSDGRLAIAVHDAPCSACSHVWVTFTSVAVHASNGSGSGWTTINVSGATVDVATLNGTAMAKTIGIGTLAPGHYEQVRLTVSRVVVELANGTNVTASVPNATSADVNGPFDIAAGSTTTISIDIDLASSLHVQSNGPVVRAVFTPHLGSVVVG
ncbi:MAG TPA: DUF4382 domain-containing protein [Thermoplasmata archaeon]|nr:DUF4382 domain-containing protein [Thermoplasmata archaeon]